MNIKEFKEGKYYRHSKLEYCVYIREIIGNVIICHIVGTKNSPIISLNNPIADNQIDEIKHLFVEITKNEFEKELKSIPEKLLNFIEND